MTLPIRGENDDEAIAYGLRRIMKNENTLSILGCKQPTQAETPVPPAFNFGYLGLFRV